MTEYYTFFDSAADDARTYQASDFAMYFSQFIGNGIMYNESGPNLQVKTPGMNMTTYVDPGFCAINGRLYENTAALYLTHDTADPTLDRIDRVVLRLDLTAQNRFIKAFIKKGAPASSPVAPDLQRDDFVFEVSLAKVRIIAGKSFIETSQISDERFDINYCGYAKKINRINPMKATDAVGYYPSGVSYFDVTNDSSWPFSNGTVLNIKIHDNRFTQIIYSQGAAGVVGAQIRHYYALDGTGWTPWYNVAGFLGSTMKLPNGNSIDSISGGIYFKITDTIYASIRSDGSFKITVNGVVKHSFNADGTKTGGTIEIDGRNLGMSPVDSPQILIETLITDIQLSESGVRVNLNPDFALAVNSFAVFSSNNTAIVTEKGTDYFIVQGTGLCDFIVKGTRRGFDNVYWINPENPPEETMV